MRVVLSLSEPLLLTRDTWSWEEHVENCKNQGEEIDENNTLHRANFECWMRERAGLNASLQSLNDMGKSLLAMIGQVNNYLKKLEEDQSSLSFKSRMENGPRRG